MAEFEAPLVVVDSCVFPTQWIKRIVERAAIGHIRPIWAPCIIAESNRVMTWLWLKRNPDFSDQAQDLLSKSAKDSFSHLTRTFRVVDDVPPYEEAWTQSVRDPMGSAHMECRRQGTDTVRSTGPVRRHIQLEGRSARRNGQGP